MLALKFYKHKKEYYTARLIEDPFLDSKSTYLLMLKGMKQQVEEVEHELKI